MVINTTVTGASHIESGKGCQDYSMTWQNRYSNIIIAAVSDGHGGKEFVNSALGARIACTVTVETLKEVAMTIKSIPLGKGHSIIQPILRSIIARWNSAIASIKNTDSVKTYGCTLIAYLQCREYWIGIQIGDGKFVTLNQDGIWSQPIPWDDKCILNYTTSMCDDVAIDEFRIAIGHIAPTAVFLSSDGIDSTFDDGEYLYNFYRNILESLSSSDSEKAASLLPDVLSHFSEIGSKDDMSLAIITN